MTVFTLAGDGCPPIPFDEPLREEVARIGGVRAIVAPEHAVTAADVDRTDGAGEVAVASA
jgi:hypothetical protein